MEKVDVKYFIQACKILGLPSRLGDLDNLAYNLYLKDGSTETKDNKELE